MESSSEHGSPTHDKSVTADNIHMSGKLYVWKEEKYSCCKPTPKTRASESPVKVGFYWDRSNFLEATYFLFLSKKKKLDQLDIPDRTRFAWFAHSTSFHGEAFEGSVSPTGSATSNCKQTHNSKVILKVTVRNTVFFIFASVVGSSHL